MEQRSSACFITRINGQLLRHRESVGERASFWRTTCKDKLFCEGTSTSVFTARFGWIGSFAAAQDPIAPCAQSEHPRSDVDRTLLLFARCSGPSRLV